MTKGFDHLGHAQVFEGFDFCGDDAEDRSVAVGLLEIVAAETVLLVHLVSEIEVAVFLETLPALGRADFAEHVAHLLGGKSLLADGHDLAMATNFGRLPLGEMEVRGATVDENLEKLVDVGHGWGSFKNRSEAEKDCRRQPEG